MNTPSAQAFIIATRAASGYVYLSRKSTSAALAGTTDAADALPFASLAALLAWVDALELDVRDTLRSRAPFAIHPITRAALPLAIPDWNWDAAWSPTSDPIDVEFCRGSRKRYAVPKTQAEPLEGSLLKATA